VRLRNRVVDGYWSVDVSVLHTPATEQLGEYVALLREVVSVLGKES
jgi:uncharacterized protein YutE (UPF0331/DUF86 family)